MRTHEALPFVVKVLHRTLRHTARHASPRESRAGHNQEQSEEREAEITCRIVRLN